MTFSPDAEFPVINTEKGRLEGHFSAEFAPSEALPRLVKLEAGIKVNVVPGKAWAVVEGVDTDTLERTAKEVEKETAFPSHLSRQRAEWASRPREKGPMPPRLRREECPYRTSPVSDPASSCGLPPDEGGAFPA